MSNNTLIKAEIEEVIKVIATIGSGLTQNDPIKEVTQYWSKDGQLLFTIKNS
ncbi:hypothetical protein ACFOZ1_06855 [Gracilibacillus marinus]|uniref:Uncharacterized protein n=1 Tax=Gracilibacillus marinus TaxID=630535 RepID=A0ABV8VSW7_9BACI